MYKAYAECNSRPKLCGAFVALNPFHNMYVTSNTWKTYRIMYDLYDLLPHRPGETRWLTLHTDVQTYNTLQTAAGAARIPLII